MICLGIESTAHTFGVGIIGSDKRVYVNVKKAFTTNEGEGGMIPAEVADHHVKIFDSVLKEAFEKAGLKPDDIDLVSYSQSPGIGNMLSVGAMAARCLASMLDKPVIGVNHCIAHLEVGKILGKNAKGNTPEDPVLLYASGANTQVVAFEGRKYRIFGETLDMGVGNFLDAFARYMGLGFPGGLKIHQLAQKGENYISIPYVVKGMDISLGGILTNLKQKYDSKKYSKEDLCYSIEQTVYPMLVEVSERAMAHTGKEELLLGGGVAANKTLQQMCVKMCEERGAECFVVPVDIAVDNGLMIAWLGLLQYNSGQRMSIEEAGIKPYLRTDQVEVNW